MPHDDQISSEQISVRELMRLESAQAITQARMGGADPTQTSSAWPQQGSGAQDTELILIAIYGSGTRLLAQVNIGGDHYLFEQGRAHASGRHSKETEYVLDSISKSCVRLLHGETRHTLCLHPDLRTPQ